MKPAQSMQTILSSSFFCLSIFYFTSINSISKIRFEFGGISGGYPFAPYPRLEGTYKVAFDPFGMYGKPNCQPRIMPDRGNSTIPCDCSITAPVAISVTL